MDLMKERSLTLPEIMLIGGTRIALGAGIALLLAQELLISEEGQGGHCWQLVP